MQLLTVDIGTGTQDIFLYDSQLDLENGFKMEVESLISKDISYVTEQYAPSRLKAGDWLD